MSKCTRKKTKSASRVVPIHSNLAKLVNKIQNTAKMINLSMISILEVMTIRDPINFQRDKGE
ncbi:MAG: hypothetical protein VW894_05535 [Gammaproteobacteria bacterium]